MAQKRVKRNKHGVLILVDPDEQSARDISVELRESGFELLLARDDRGFWRTLDSLPAVRRPVVMLIDCVLPAMSGFELVRRVVEQHPRWKIPIFMIGKHPSTEDRVEATHAGAQGLLPKPVSKGALFEQMEAYKMRRLRLEIGGMVMGVEGE